MPELATQRVASGRFLSRWRDQRLGERLRHMGVIVWKVGPAFDPEVMSRLD